MRKRETHACGGPSVNQREAVRFSFSRHHDQTCSLRQGLFARRPDDDEVVHVLAVETQPGMTVYTLDGTPYFAVMHAPA